MLKAQGFLRHTICLIMGMLLFCSVRAHEGQAAQVLEHESLAKPTGAVILTVGGLVGRTNIDQQAQFDLAMLQALPASTVYTSTVVTDGVKRFDGVLVRDVFNALRPSSKSQKVEAIALNDYLVDIPFSDFYDYDVLLATHMDGVLLTPADKGPIWIVYPRDSIRKLQDIRYDYRWVWQLKHLHIR